jgi:hypothetical protein
MAEAIRIENKQNKGLFYLCSWPCVEALAKDKTREILRNLNR